jgi:hypothetical protein
MAAVWGSTSVEDGNLTVNIAAVRETLASGGDQTVYIETIPRRGYRFAVAIVEESPLSASEFPRGYLRGLWGLALLLLLFAVSGVLFWWEGGTVKVGRVEINSPADAADVRKAIRDAEEWESLVLETNPDSADESRLKQYFLPENLGGKEIVQVKATLDRLRKNGRHYGPESRIERFDFAYTRIFAPGDSATAGTIERWFLPLYEKSGQLVPLRNVFFGPYAVDYRLRKVDGVWLIEESTTPRAKPLPRPASTAIQKK